MEITKEQIKRLSNAVKVMQNDTLVDDDVSGGYQPEPFKTSYTEIYKVIDECERGLNIDVGKNNSTGVKEPIDIYSPEGTKVKYTGRGGHEHHKKHANKYLKIDGIYTIDHTNVSNWYTDVYLKEVPNEAFNSVHFINAD